MSELKKFDYFYLRYSPYPMMDDYVTFGIVMLEADPEGFAGVRFMKAGDAFYVPTLTPTSTTSASWSTTSARI